MKEPCDVCDAVTFGGDAHGGEPASIAFCHNIGLNYVSCSPYRVPIARLAAAQANLTDSGANRDR